MKKLYVIICAVLINVVLFSCNPESLVDQNEPVACCGEGAEIPPPPPLTDKDG